MKPLLMVPTTNNRSFFANLLKHNPESEEIDFTQISEGHLTLHYKRNAEKGLKQRITRAINLITADPKYSNFKIGKTGVPAKRTKEPKNHIMMFLLCKSNFRDLIEELEKHYNKKYKKHPKNDNINGGRSAKMSSTNAFFYLYIVLA